MLREVIHYLPDQATHPIKNRTHPPTKMSQTRTVWATFHRRTHSAPAQFRANLPQPSPLTATSLRASHPATTQHLDTTVEPLHSPAHRHTPGSRMFVPPRHPDDPATFNLWTEGGKFRGLTGDESSWIQRVTQCTSILQTSPFICKPGPRDGGGGPQTISFVERVCKERVV